MNGQQIAKYLQNYLNDVITPKIENVPGEGDKIENLLVQTILKGSSINPLLHIFIDTVPTVKTNTTHNYRKLMKIDKDIEDFFKYLTIQNKIKVHWNKRPTGVEPKNYDFSI